MEHKTVSFEVLKQDGNGGEIIINTPTVDRDRDRVMPKGARLENYLKNPVVQWGHNYSDPWATIGKTTGLSVDESGMVAKFAFREPVNETDPMHIIKALWEGGLVNTASIGFNPIKADENEGGGYDFTDWELLEWSLVPIPSNQEALRLAVKGLDAGLLVVLDEHRKIPAEANPEHPPALEVPLKEIDPRYLAGINAFITAVKEEL